MTFAEREMAKGKFDYTTLNQAMSDIKKTFYDIDAGN